MDQLQLKNLCSRFGNLNKTEFFVAGLCAGITSVRPELILKFVEKGNLIREECFKAKFYVNAANGDLGKAKEILNMSTNKLQKNKALSQRLMNICRICEKSAHDKEIEYLDNCADLFHKECIQKYIQGQITENQYPIKCPECKVEVSSVFIKLKVGQDYYEKYSYCEISCAVDCIDCPITGCKGVISFSVQKDKVECMECKNLVCLNCGVKYHEGLSCEEYLSKMNDKCPFCHLVTRAQTGLKKCKCSHILCGKCSYPVNLCKCEHKRINL